MRKVCEVYLVSSSATDERGVELTFPVSQYEMMDAFEQIHTKSPGDVYWQVDEFYCFDYLAPHLDESMSIFEFNSLTEQLSKLDERQETALEGLLQMQVDKHVQENSGIITVPELMMLAANVDRCHVLANLHLQESLQHRFLQFVHSGKLLRQGIKLEDRHTLVQTGRKVGKAVEFIHLPVDIAW